MEMVTNLNLNLQRVQATEMNVVLLLLLLLGGLNQPERFFFTDRLPFFRHESYARHRRPDHCQSRHIPGILPVTGKKARVRHPPSGDSRNDEKHCDIPEHGEQYGRRSHCKS